MPDLAWALCPMGCGPVAGEMEPAGPNAGFVKLYRHLAAWDGEAAEYGACISGQGGTDARPLPLSAPTVAEVSTQVQQVDELSLF